MDNSGTAFPVDNGGMLPDLGLTKRELFAAMERVTDDDVPTPGAQKAMGWPPSPVVPTNDATNNPTPADSYRFWIGLQARIRVMISAAHAKADLDQGLEAFKSVGKKLGVI